MSLANHLIECIVRMGYNDFKSRVHMKEQQVPDFEIKNSKVQKSIRIIYFLS